MSLPVGLDRLVDADELIPPSDRQTEGPTGSREFETLMEQVNDDEAANERVDLSIGGHVLITVSAYNWVLAHAEYSESPHTDIDLARAEFVDAGGHSEAILRINIETGEIWSVQTNRRGESMVSNVIKGP